MIPKLTLSKSIAKVSNKLPFIHRLKSIGRPIISPLNKALSFIESKDRLCDIGCGNGTLLHLALEFSKVSYAYGYDVSKEAIENNVLREYNKDLYDIKVSYKLPNLNDFNTITLLDVLHHLPKKNQNAFLEKIILQMPFNSTFVLMDINASNFIGRWANQLHDLIISREWVNPKKMVDVIDLLNKFDVNIIHKSKHQSFWYSHYLVVVRKR